MVRSPVLLLVVILLAIALGLVWGYRFVVRQIAAIEGVLHRLAQGDLSARLTVRTCPPGLRVLVAATNALAMALETQQRARDQAEAQWQQLATIVENSDDAILSTTLEGTIVSWNAGAERLYGFTAAEAVGRTLALCVPEESTPELQSHLDAQRRGERIKQFETVRRRKDGSLVPVSITLSSIRDAHGTIIGGAGIVRNISERHRAEDALRHAEERLRYALETAQVGIWEGNPQADRFYWSALYEHLHGLTPGTFGGTFAAFLACVYSDDRERVLDVIARAARDRAPASFEYRTIWADGTTHWIRATGHYEYDTAGRPVRGAGVAVDVTAQRSLEEQLRQSQKMDAIGRLAGGVAHDFNNMLTVIVGYGELVLESLAVDDARRTDVQGIVNAAHRSATLTHQLLAFSRKQILSPRVIRLADVVRDITPMLQRLLGETIVLAVTTDDQAWVKADPGQLEQVLFNLAVNARDAMPDGGHLAIHTADVLLDEAAARRHAGMRPGPQVLIAVTDTGHGMDAVTQLRVFEPFFTTKPKGQGTGLGLATAYGIVKQSGGYITLSSRPGHGTTFRIYVPQTDDFDVPPERAIVATNAHRGTETILLVEDEDLVRTFTAKALRQCGYVVHVFGDCGDAIAFATSSAHPIHLVLSDVVLPDMGGPALAAQVIRLHPAAAVLYMSGYTDEAIVRHGVLDPDVSFLPKPFTADGLLKKVREVLEAGPNRR